MTVTPLSQRIGPRPPENAASPDPLSRRILAELLRAGPATGSRLAALLGEPEDEIVRQCDRMTRRRTVIALRPPDLAILLVLIDEARRVTTPELETTSGVSGAYRRCRRVEDLGILASDRRKSGQMRYFFPVTRQVLTRTTYPGIVKVIQDLQAIARREAPGGATIPHEVRRLLLDLFVQYLRRLAAKATPKEREQVEAFLRELIAVLSATTRSEVIRLVGIRPFHPWVREWWIADAARAAAIRSAVGSRRARRTGSSFPDVTVYVAARRPRPAS